MNVIVNGRKAWIKKGSSFTLVFENRAFTDADGYSFNIIFPIAGCPDNIKIFGHLNRSDVDNPRSLFDCEISYLNFTLTGVLTITGMNDTEITAQFLEGRSAQNYDVTFDDIYINELNLGEPQFIEILPADAWAGLDGGRESVVLPWVNNSKGTMQNDVVYSDGNYKWAEGVTSFSHFPYLIAITKKIFESLGYSYDISEWENSPKKYLLLCNALPVAWEINEFARALPHWSVTEFFEKLELFIGGEFEFNHKTKHVDFSFIETIISSTPDVCINTVVDSFSVEIDDDADCGYKGNAHYQYKECDHNMQKYYSCNWFLQENKDNVLEYNTLQELINGEIHHRQLDYSENLYTTTKVLYAKDVDMYFILRVWLQELISPGNSSSDYYTYTILQPLNLFGNSSLSEDTNVIELEFVPACIQETEKGKGHCLFLSFADFDEDLETETPIKNPVKEGFNTLTDINLRRGEREKHTAYYDYINVAYWDGVNHHADKLPYPTLHCITIREGWSYFVSDYSLALPNIKPKMPLIDSSCKYQFSFITDNIPNVRSVFFINGKKYLCEKITATFTENGMSQLLKGEFYRIVD